jgi:hypothetical protein
MLESMGMGEGVDESSHWTLSSFTGWRGGDGRGLDAVG